MSWKAIARFAVGTSHQEQKIPCQDYGHYRIFNDVIVGTVADGAGSAK
ncbi:MAG: protein phosphatase 2C domain-containing protein [Sphaerospermopsis kisseleviana]